MFKPKRRFIILILLLVVAFLFLSYQIKGYPPVNEILLKPFDFFNGLTSGIRTSFLKLRHSVDENERLNNRLSELLVERQYYGEIMLQNERLRAILGLKETNPAFFATAQAVARGYDRFLGNMIIDKGKNHGIVKNMPVVTVNGLAGKIHVVRDDYSEVLLLNDPNFSVAVRLQKSRHEGVLSGTGRGYCLLKYIPPEEFIEKDELVITSGLDGIFPHGIPIGIISNIRREGAEFFLHLEVTPFQSSSKIEEVVILKPLITKTSKHDFKK
jgi:rod shape-determining protein MreC